MLLTANGHNGSNAMIGHRESVSLAGLSCGVLLLCQEDLRRLKLSQAPYGLSNNPGRRGRVSEKRNEDRRRREEDSRMGEQNNGRRPTQSKHKGICSVSLCR